MHCAQYPPAAEKSIDRDRSGLLDESKGMMVAGSEQCKPASFTIRDNGKHASKGSVRRGLIIPFYLR
jgi:hypothetical protein